MIAPSEVADRLREAAQTFRRLPSCWPRDVRAVWPVIVRDAAESYGWQDVQLRLGPPTGDAIDRADECARWVTRYVETERDRRIVWGVASKVRRRHIARFAGCSIETVRRHWLRSMREISMRVNHDDVPRYEQRLPGAELRDRGMRDAAREGGRDGGGCDAP